MSYLLLATAGALVVHISTSHSKYFPKNILLLRLLVENISFVKGESESESESESQSQSQSESRSRSRPRCRSMSAC